MLRFSTFVYLQSFLSLACPILDRQISIEFRSFEFQHQIRSLHVNLPCILSETFTFLGINSVTCMMDAFVDISQSHLS